MSLLTTLTRRCFFKPSQLKTIGLTEYGISLYEFTYQENQKLEEINKQYMDLLEKTQKYIEDGDKDEIAKSEFLQGKFREQIAEMGTVGRLFN